MIVIFIISIQIFVHGSGRKVSGNLCVNFVHASIKTVRGNLCVNVSVIGCSDRSEESTVEVLLPLWAVAGEERGRWQHQ